MLYKKLNIPLNLPRTSNEDGDVHKSNENIIYEIINSSKNNQKSLTISFKNYFTPKIPSDNVESLNILLNEVIPIILLSKDFQQGLYQLLRFLESIVVNLNFINTVLKKKYLFHNLSEILSFSGYLTNFISKDIKLLDILDPNYAIRLNENITFYKTSFDKIDPNFHDQEGLLDLFRKNHRFLKFQILFSLIREDIDIKRFSKELSFLAQATLNKAIDIVEKSIHKKYNIELNEYCIIAYGRFATLSMSSNSDLDLVFIYNDQDKSKQSNRHVYKDLFRQLINILSNKTNEGTLYDVDTKLRPSGKIGPTVSTFSNFKNHHQNKAFSWEKLALKKTRIVSKENNFSLQISELINNLNNIPISFYELSKEIILMRNNPNHNDIKKINPLKWFETKYTAGGQRNIEFIRYFYEDKSHLEISHEIEKKLFFLKKTETLFFKVDQIMNVCFLDKKQDDLTFKAISLLINETQEKDLGSLKLAIINGKVEIYNILNKFLTHYAEINLNK